MAGILDRYGIKEVADVTFYKLDNAGVPTYPVLYLDTLKVSTIEQTADEATANGGKGNPPLVIWDYNKDITVTLEDALFSAKSLAIMFGDGTLKDIAQTNGQQLIMKSEVFTCKGGSHPSDSDSGWESKYTDPNGKLHDKLNAKFYTEKGVALGDANTASISGGEKYFCSYDLAVQGSVVEVSANSFPGTYYVTGDTYARSDVSGEDEFFQFIIPKAKVQSENTITLEADGDPSTFNMSLHVMRPENGKMMMLVKYKTLPGTTQGDSSTADIYHNHYLDVTTEDVGTNREVAPANGTLRIKTMPARALYSIDEDVTSGAELEQYNSTTGKWTTVESPIEAYADNNGVPGSEINSAITEDTVVWLGTSASDAVGPITILGYTD